MFFITQSGAEAWLLGFRAWQDSSLQGETLTLRKTGHDPEACAHQN